jgi:hypothetical protein
MRAALIIATMFALAAGASLARADETSAERARPFIRVQAVDPALCRRPAAAAVARSAVRRVMIWSGTDSSRLALEPS